MYAECSICKNLHDDGGIVEVNGKKYFVCMDCLDAHKGEEVKNIIAEKQRKFDDRKYEVGDIVAFCADDKELNGVIAVVDRFGGGVYQNICTSYDIKTDNVLYKHVPEKNILKKLQ